MLPRQPKRWIISEKLSAEIDAALAAYPPYFRQMLFARGIRDEAQADYYIRCTVDNDDPYQMTDVLAAVDRLNFAIDKKESIAVYGDYDVDGVTATALLTEVLERFGADVQAYIPNRFDEGYGLNIEAIEALAAQGVQLVVTVDCGIRSPREAERASELGLDLIISDHHHPAEELPNAHAVICPKQPGDRYPEKDLSGVGLAYKLAQALCIRRSNTAVCAEDWLDLVALGTVADIVPLRGENRSLVRRGLQRLRTGSRQGLVSLAGTAGVKLHTLSSGDIGFMIGPRLNAAGRIDTAQDALRLLMSRDVMEAGKLAQQLDNQNRHRQEMTREMQRQAEEIARTQGSEHILFAFSDAFSSGVVGLAASRLVDSYYRPAIVGEMGPETTRASCRSIPEFHITRALDACADILERHGGHAVAAGFTVRNEHLPELKRRLQTLAEQALDGLELRPVLHADLEIPLSDLKPEILRYLDWLQPTGQENAEAVFVSRGLRVVRANAVGADKQHLKMVVSDGRISYDAIAFRQGHRMANMPPAIDLMYTYERNEYNGRVSLQLNVRDIKTSGAAD